MRSVLLLLILCVSFETLDSVSRFRHPSLEFPRVFAAPPTATAEKTVFVPIVHRNAAISYSAQLTATPVRHLRWSHHATARPALGGTHLASALEVVSNHLSALDDDKPVQRPMDLPVSVSVQRHPSKEAAARLEDNTDVLAAIADIKAAAASDAPPLAPPGSKDAPGIVEATEETHTTVSGDLALGGNALSLSPLAKIFEAKAPLALRAGSARNLVLATRMVDSIRNSLMAPHGIQFGGEAGLAWVAPSISGGKTQSMPGFTLGAFADIPFNKHFSFRPKVQYTYGSYSSDAGGQVMNNHVAYLKVPLDLVYHSNWFHKRAFVGAGPYVAQAFNGTYSFKGINTDMRFGNSAAAGDDLRSTDFGVHFTGGLLMDRNFLLGAQIDLGLHNMAPEGSLTTFHNRSVGLSVMYVFRNRANSGIVQGFK